MIGEHVAAALHLPDSWASRLGDLEAAGDPDRPVVLPSGLKLTRQLKLLAVPAVDHDGLGEAFATIDTDPAWRWLLERSVKLLRVRMGDYTGVEGGPSLPEHTGPTGAYFYVAVFCAMVPDVLAYHRSRGISEEQTWAILSDVGEKLEVHRRRTGHGGINTQFWFTYHECGVIFSAGRLQFNLNRLPTDAGAHRSGEPCVNLHIPEWGGPLTSSTVDASLAFIRPFLAAHFPEHPAAVATCDSWLLDRQLAHYLPPTSNVVQFGERFTRFPLRPDADELTDAAGVATTPGDRSVLEFVFRRGDRPLADLPRRTSMENAVLDHLAAGRHWHQESGSLELAQ